ncbi:MAG: hypothetical protein ABR542_11545 [Desulfonatronovibrio sp.]|nr:hypothetical protein [Desulfovibrionales bacterium]
MKYIIFEDFAGEPTPIIFPERIEFIEMRELVPYTTVLSAGLMKIEGLKVKCFSQSKELGVSPLEHDPEIIADHLVIN